MTGTAARIARLVLLGVFAAAVAAGCSAGRECYYDEYNDEYIYEVDQPPEEFDQLP